MYSSIVNYAWIKLLAQFHGSGPPSVIKNSSKDKKRRKKRKEYPA
jgi:hypothetical protein